MKTGLLIVAGLWILAGPAPAEPVSASLESRRQEIAKRLEEVNRFWLDPEREDKEFGGMLYYLDENLRPTRDTKKNIMMQLRVLFNYSKGLKSGEDRQFPDLAQRLDRQLDYLVARFRDPSDGTWWFELERDGRPVEPKRKLMIAQVYVIYLLSEVYLLTGNKKALQLAEEAFAAVELAHDPVFGGYRQRSDRGAWDKENLRKSCATNLHMLLALTRLSTASDKPVYRERLSELYELLPRYMAPSGNAYWALTHDWRPVPFDEGINNRTMYGHNAELLWYLTEAAVVLGRNEESVRPVVKQLADALVKYGVGETGAVYFFGPIDGPSDDRQVQWWAPVEAMIALLRAYRWTGETRYWEAYEKVADWTFRHFVPENTPGAWFTVAGPDGTITDARRGGYIWKSGFHEIRGLNILREEFDLLLKARHEHPAGK